MRTKRRFSPRAIFLCLAVASLFAATAALAGVKLAILPAEIVVDPGAVFEVELTVPEPGSSFNGYDAVVGYDPTVLTFLRQSPLSLQEGDLMKSACPTRFHVFDLAADSTSLSVSHVLLCAGVSVTGPGVVYQLQFQAKPGFAVTSLRLLDGTAFYDAGLYVEPVETDDALIRVGANTAAPTPRPAGLQLRAWPNPFNPRTRVHFVLDQTASVGLDLYDLSGRHLRTLIRATLSAGPQSVSWDGRDAEGRMVASGAYLLKLRTPARESSLRVVLLK